MTSGAYKKLRQLGRPSSIPASPEKAMLERAPKPFFAYDYLVRLNCPELTSLCPVTGQPDFAHVVVDYVPGKWLVESKSFKLFMQSFRTYGAFHDDCTVMIGHRLIKSIAPKWIRVSGYWYPRGGIPIDVFFQRGKLPAQVFVPDTGVAPYRGRG